MEQLRPIILAGGRESLYEILLKLPNSCDFFVDYGGGTVVMVRIVMWASFKLYAAPLGAVHHLKEMVV